MLCFICYEIKTWTHCSKLWLKIYAKLYKQLTDWAVLWNVIGRSDGSVLGCVDIKSFTKTVEKTFTLKGFITSLF